MRKVISATQISVDGYIEDAEGNLDWVASWEDEYGLLDRVDTCVLGNGEAAEQRDRGKVYLTYGVKSR